MKQVVMFILICCLLSCNNNPRSSLKSTGFFGEAIGSSTPLSVKAAIEQITPTQQSAIITGTIVDFCQGEGCWLTLENKGSEPFLVEIKNNAFVLPYHISGKTVVAQGVVVMDSTENGTPAPKFIANGIEIK